jgi:hypothetical protein
MPACTGLRTEMSLLTVLEHTGRLKRAGMSVVVCNCKGLRRPIDGNLVVEVRKDHVVCGRRPHESRWTNPCRNRRVNRHRQLEQHLRKFWRRQLDELRWWRRQEAGGNGRWWRKVVGGVALS